MTERYRSERRGDRNVRLAIRDAASTEAQLDILKDWLGSPVDLAAEHSPNLESLASFARADAKPSEISSSGSLPSAAPGEPMATIERPAARSERGNKRELPDRQGAAFVPEVPGEVLRDKPARKQKPMGAVSGPTRLAAPLRQRRVSHYPSREPTEPPRFLSVQNVAHRYNVSVATIWRAVADGSFPRPRKIMRNATRWAVADLDAHDRAMAQS